MSRFRFALVAVALFAAATMPAARFVQAQNFVVILATDEPDQDPGDGACAICTHFNEDGVCTALGGCTLRAAIEQSNAAGGSGIITFAVGGVQIMSDLPNPAGAVTVDGALGAGGRAVVDGQFAGDGTAFDFQAGGSTLRNIQVVGFGRVAEFVGDANTVESCVFQQTGAIGDAVLTFAGGAGHEVTDCTISNNGGIGILFNGSTSVRVAGCTITSNALDGIFMDGADGVIGGLADAPGVAPGNVISGNGSAGIRIVSPSGPVTVQGNLIGTDDTGAAAFPNSGRGITANSGSHALVTIGGPDGRARNVISGNAAQGVFLSGAGDVIQGNIVGLDISGMNALPNDEGVWIENGSDHRIVDNVISGNSQDGVVLSLNGENNLVAGNIIGLDAAGHAAHPNGRAGIGVFYNQTGAVIRDNTVAGNAQYGIWLFGNESSGEPNGAVITGNAIGIQADGGEARPNGGSGILLQDLVFDTQIGGEGEGGNVIAHNEGDGIRILQGTGNEILGNSIFGNKDLGIDLGGDGSTPNDALDVDNGPNNLQNAPAVVFWQDGGDTRLSGILASTPGASYRIEFFANPAAEDDPAQAELYLGATTVTTGGDGVTSFREAFEGTYEGITATATDPEGNTSELGSGNLAADADVYVDKFGFPDDTVAVGDTLMYRLIVGNAGPGTAYDVVVRDPIPPSVGYLATETSPGPRASGLACKMEMANMEAQEVTCTIASLQPTGPEEQVVVTIYAQPLLHGTLENSATVTAGTPDASPGNNASGSVVTQVVEDVPEADLKVSLSGPTGGVVEAGSFFEGTITLTNEGPDVADDSEVTIRWGSPEVAFPWKVSWEEEGTSCEPSETNPERETTCIVSEMDPGDSREVTVTTGVRYDAAGRTGTMTATSAGSDTDPDNGDNTVTIEFDVEDATSTADVEITKSVDKDVVNNGDTLTYILEVTNHGPDDAHKVVVTDFPPVTPFASTVEILWDQIATEKGACDQQLGDGVTGLFFDCRLGTVTPFEQVTIQIPMKVVLADDDPVRSLFNKAIVNSITPDPNHENNETGEVEAIVRGPLEVTVTVRGPESSFVGDSLTFTISVRNHGTVEAQDVNVLVRLSSVSKLMITEQECQYHVTTDVRICSIGTIAPNGTKRIRIKTLAPAAQPAGLFAEASSADGRTDVGEIVREVGVRPYLFDVISLLDWADVQRVSIMASSSSSGNKRAQTPTVNAIDIYVDSVRIANDLALGESLKTDTFALRSTTIRVDIANGADADNSAPILSQEMNLLVGEGASTHLSKRTALLIGTWGDEAALNLLMRKDFRWSSLDASAVDVFVAHAASNTAPLQVKLLDAEGALIEALSDSLGFGKVTDYVSTHAGVRNFEFTTADSGELTEVIRLDLTEYAGEALALVLTDDGAEGLRLNAIDSTGAGTDGTVVTGSSPEEELPARFSLRGNYPNPFNPSTTIRFDLPTAAKVRVEIYDLLGRSVLTLPQEEFAAGAAQTLSIDAMGLASGVYLYRLIAETPAETQVEAGRMVLMK